jgi:hypothetical protein
VETYIISELEDDFRHHFAIAFHNVALLWKEIRAVDKARTDKIAVVELACFETIGK